MHFLKDNNIPKTQNSKFKKKNDTRFFKTSSVL